jgi:hypothetical protein
LADKAVRLDFNDEGRLGAIWVHEGYEGTYRGAAIGDSLARISSIEALWFGAGDDMYYRVDASEDIIPGFAIFAYKEDAALHGEVPIDGFCVHDWDYFKVPPTR